MLKTPCHLSLFAFVEPPRSIVETEASAKQELLSLRDSSKEPWPRDLNLVLIIGERTTADPAIIRRLVDNRYVYRCYILDISSRSIDDALRELPFLPPDGVLGGGQSSIGNDVRHLLRGYDPKLIDALSGYSPGADKIVENILGAEYHMGAELAGVSEYSTPRLQPARKRRLEALEIHEFRGVRCLSPEDMSLAGDVVLIYGPNGIGKTSIAQSIEWAITGQIDRLSDKRFRSSSTSPDPVTNVFAQEDVVRVRCLLSDGNS